MSRSLVLNQSADGIEAVVRDMNPQELNAPGLLRVRVAYSSMNYKDALAVTGRGKIIRARYPFVPGIDFVGEVIESRSERFNVGDRVVGTGGGLGETMWGGYTELLTVPDTWLVSLPVGLSVVDSMIIGTAGLTAMLSVMKLNPLVARQEEGRVVVTGASGGVGSLSTLFLGRSGFRVVVSTGKKDNSWLRAPGVEEVIDRTDLGAGPRRDLDSTRWLGAVDTVGGQTLGAILSQVGRHGHVSACGLVGGASLETTVYPLILRGVTIHGIDSNTCPLTEREEAWSRIADICHPGDLEASLEDDYS